MWSNQENRVRKQEKNPCEAHKIKASQNFRKKLALTSCRNYVVFVLCCQVLQSLYLRALRHLFLFVWSYQKVSFGSELALKLVSENPCMVSCYLLFDLLLKWLI